MNLAQILIDSWRRDPDHVAIKLDDAELSYAQLNGASAHFVGLLREHGFQHGDRVGIMLPNVPYFPVCYYGVLRAGGIVVPMNVLLKKREIAFYLKDSGARLLFAWDGFADDARAGADEAGAECILVKAKEFEYQVGAARPLIQVPETQDGDTAVILYTSGTTGTPKGAELSHANLTRNAIAAGRLFGAGSDAVMLGGLPLFHSFGQTCGMNATIAGGGTLTMIPRFDPGKALEIIERDRVNIFLGVPTMYGAILHHPEHERYDTSTLRLCGSGGSAMPVELCGASRRRSAARCSRATDFRRRRRWRRSTRQTGSASRARSECRSRASRCDCSTTSTRRWDRMRSERS
jgi:long-chain acyl-CoA synthetase